MSRGPGKGALVAILLTACGGEVRTGGPDRTVEAAPDGGRTPASSNGSGETRSDPPGGTVALPECPHGFKAGAAIGKLCTYVTNGLCYETKLDACACACPKQSGTVCSSGFPETDGTTKVTCK